MPLPTHTAPPHPAPRFPGLAERASAEALIVCRTREAARAALDDLACGSDRAAWAGVHLTTLSGLLSQAAGVALLQPAPEAGAPPLPPGHPWAAQLDDRLRLRGLLAGHLSRLHALREAGDRLDGLDPKLLSLVDQGWGRSGWVDAVHKLLQAPPAARTVVQLGFGEGGFSCAGRVGALERRLLSALGASPDLEPPVPHKLAAPLRTLLLADVHAEARVAAAWLGGGDALVLAPDEASASRLRSVLSRNQVPVAERGFSALSHHGLIAILRPLVPLFGSKGASPVDYEALLHLLVSPLLSRGTVVEEDPEAEDAEVNARLSVQHARELLLRCRKVRAPLDQWRERLRGEAFELSTKEAGAEGAAKLAIHGRLVSAERLVERLELLQTHAQRGTLAALADFTLRVKLSDPSGDRLGRAVLRALKQAGAVLATPEGFEEALQGSLSSGQLADGVEVMLYDDYDGRQSARLVCTGVHDRGVGQSPPHDPFLRDSDFAVLGIARGDACVEERLRLLRWAVSRSKEALALAPLTDSSGRRVSLPPQLREELAIDERWANDAYGLKLESFARLPDRDDLGALSSGEGKPDEASLQVDAEWLRVGRLAGDDSSRPLPELLSSDVQKWPQQLRPLMGFVPQGALPKEFRLSATRLGDFTRCLYRAFLAHALKLRAPEDVQEDYTPAEVGDFIHEALSDTTRGLRWYVPQQDLEATRTKLLDALCAATEQKFAVVDDARLGSDLSKAILSARDGVVARWKRHWKEFVDSRVCSVEARADEICARGLKSAARWEEFERAHLALGGDELGTEAAAKRLAKGLKQALPLSGHDPAAFATCGALFAALGTKRDPDGEAKVVRGRLGTEAGKAAVAELCQRWHREVAANLPHPDGDAEVVEVELPFDFDAKSLGPAGLPIKGQIDSVVLHQGRLGQPAYHVVDYKTGSPGGVKAVNVDHNLTEPQLPFYAVALNESLAQEGAALPQRPIRGLAYDRVKASPIELGFDEPQRLRFTEAVTALMRRVDDGQFPLRPHPTACPHASNARCDFAEICRFRASPEPEPGTGESEGT